MDILAHGLWSGLAARAVNIKVRWAIFWGVIPDFFAFTVPFIVMFARGILPFRPGEPPRDIDLIFRHTTTLYSISHSLIVFGAVFGLVYLVLRRPVWELLAWGMHILIDIPTHSYDFYPTPFLWPLSDLKVNGISWATPWFLAVNYFAIVLVFLLLRKKKKHEAEIQH